MPIWDSKEPQGNPPRAFFWNGRLTTLKERIVIRLREGLAMAEELFRSCGFDMKRSSARMRITPQMLRSFSKHLCLLQAWSISRKASKRVRSCPTAGVCSSSSSKWGTPAASNVALTIA
jgi:hypothetical protein